MEPKCQNGCKIWEIALFLIFLGQSAPDHEPCSRGTTAIQSLVAGLPTGPHGLLHAFWPRRFCAFSSPPPLFCLPPLLFASPVFTCRPPRNRARQAQQVFQVSSRAIHFEQSFCLSFFCISTFGTSLGREIRCRSKVIFFICGMVMLPVDNILISTRFDHWKPF